jgi:solute:Na+ symporter, SSS family
LRFFSGLYKSSADENSMHATPGRFAAGVGMAILPLYLVATILIGWLSRRRVSTSSDFLNATGSQPFLLASAAFISANCGALEIIGLSAVAAQYGVQGFHFYWIGAIPAMVFLSAVMMPMYMRCGARSLPEYLELRFGPRLRFINAWLLLITVTAVSGISVYAMAQVLHAVFAWPFSVGACLAAMVVLIYVLLGGLRAAIYNEVLQLLFIAGGLIPLAMTVHPPAHRMASPLDSHWHLWTSLPAFSASAPLDRFGVIFGLGCVLSINYWCTDFIQVQRALTVRTIHAGRMVPLAAGVGKLGFSFLVILPSLGAAAFLGPRMPTAYDQTLPTLMATVYPPILLGLGLTALLASLMSGLAANISAFASLWTEEIYRTSLRPGASEAHYMRMGRVAISAAIVLSIVTSYLSFCFHDLMEFVQMVFALFGAPFLSVLLMGFFTRRATEAGVTTGLACGFLSAALFHLLAITHLLHYSSKMSVNFHSAACAFVVSLIVGLLCSRSKDRRVDLQSRHLTYTASQIGSLLPTAPLWWLLASALLAACIALNIYWQ